MAEHSLTQFMAEQASHEKSAHVSDQVMEAQIAANGQKPVEDSTRTFDLVAQQTGTEKSQISLEDIQALMSQFNVKDLGDLRQKLEIREKPSAALGAEKRIQMVNGFKERAKSAWDKSAGLRKIIGQGFGLFGKSVDASIGRTMTSEGWRRNGAELNQGIDAIDAGYDKLEMAAIWAGTETIKGAATGLLVSAALTVEGGKYIGNGIVAGAEAALTGIDSTIAAGANLSERAVKKVESGYSAAVGGLQTGTELATKYLVDKPIGLTVEAARNTRDRLVSFWDKQAARGQLFIMSLDEGFHDIHDAKNVNKEVKLAEEQRKLDEKRDALSERVTQNTESRSVIEARTKELNLRAAGGRMREAAATMAV